MMSFALEEIDELVCSALAEVFNITSGNGTTAISEKALFVIFVYLKFWKRGWMPFLYRKKSELIQKWEK